MLSTMLLAVVDNVGSEVGLCSNDLDDGLECVTPNHRINKQDCLLLEVVLERDEVFILEWVLHNLEKFGPFLGLSYEGFEVETKELFKAIELLRRKSISDEGSKSVGDKHLQKELKKLENSVNYDCKDWRLSEGIVHGSKGLKLLT